MGEYAYPRERIVTQTVDAPWLAKKAWASGVIADNARSTLIGTWIFGIIWSAFTVPIAWIALFGDKPQSAGVYFVLIFPLVGLLILGAAVRLTLQRRKFGRSTLELSTFPGAIGGKLAGTIVTTRPLRLVSELTVKLSCIRRTVSGTGKNKHTSENVLWHDELKLRSDLPTDERGTRIPICFSIAREARPCDDANPRDRILWRLEANSPMPGVNYGATFDVPVFAVEQAEEIADATVKLRAEDVPAGVPEGRGITLARDASGGVEMSFSWARHPGTALVFTLFTLLLFAVPVFILYSAGPCFGAVFAAGFWLVGLLLLVASAEMWLRSTKLVVRFGSLEFTRSYGLFARTWQIDHHDVSSIETPIRMSSGTNAWHDIDVKTKDGRNYQVAKGLSKRDTELLAGELRKALKLT